jgi:hypothetical protein
MKAYPFIHKHPTTGQTTMSEGMDLRDEFAGLAMLGLITVTIQRYVHQGQLQIDMPSRDVIAESAYQMADAMLKQREVKHEQS